MASFSATAASVGCKESPRLKVGLCVPTEVDDGQLTAASIESLRTFRYEVLNLPAKLARPEGCAQLRIAAAPDTQKRIQAILNALPKTA
jgi:hypothetical protein